MNVDNAKAENKMEADLVNAFLKMGKECAIPMSVFIGALGKTLMAAAVDNRHVVTKAATFDWLDKIYDSIVEIADKPENKECCDHGH